MHETTYTLPSCPVSIALLSDLHNRPFDPVTASLRSHSPDLICITGDVINGSRPEGNELIVEKQENVLPFLEACAALAPTYLSLGNHACKKQKEVHSCYNPDRCSCQRCGRKINHILTLLSSFQYPLSYNQEN